MNQQHQKYRQHVAKTTATKTKQTTTKKNGGKKKKKKEKKKGEKDSVTLCFPLQACNIVYIAEHQLTSFEQ